MFSCRIVRDFFPESEDRFLAIGVGGIVRSRVCVVEVGYV